MVSGGSTKRINTLAAALGQLRKKKFRLAFCGLLKSLAVICEPGADSVGWIDCLEALDSCVFNVSKFMLEFAGSPARSCRAGTHRDKCAGAWGNLDLAMAMGRKWWCGD